MELALERRNQLAVLALMDKIGDMPTKDINVNKLASKLSGHIRNLPKSVTAASDNDWPSNIHVWAEEIIRRMTGLDSRIPDELFSRGAYELLLACFWSEDLKLGVNLRRRIYKDRGEATHEEVHAFFGGIIMELCSWLK